MGYLDQYGNAKMHIDQEGGLEYFLCHYTAPDYFDFDAELEQLAKNVRFYCNRLRDVLDQRISDFGGDPTDYEY